MWLVEWIAREFQAKYRYACVLSSVQLKVMTLQVTEEVRQILEKEGFTFDCRGEINVKGKGLMTTYLLRVPEQDVF